MSASSSPRLLALHGLRLKGIAEPDVVADTVAADIGPIRDELRALDDADLVSYRYGRIPGYLLTPDGRALGQRLLVEELETTGTRPAVEAAYGRFLEINTELLAVCTAWQLRETDGAMEMNDHADADHDAQVLARLERFHASASPVLDELVGILARFGGHRRRLRTALDKVLAGDHDHFTKPMFPSYHSTWFELHEDLLATLGIERSGERRALQTNDGSS